MCLTTKAKKKLKGNDLNSYRKTTADESTYYAKVRCNQKIRPWEKKILNSPVVLWGQKPLSFKSQKIICFLKDCRINCKRLLPQLFRSFQIIYLLFPLLKLLHFEGKEQTHMFALKTPLLSNKTISFMIFPKFQGKYVETKIEFLEKMACVQSRHFCFIKKKSWQTI